MDTLRSAVLIIACLSCASIGASGPLHLEQLPSPRVAPLISPAGQCACLAYEGLRQMHRDEPLISLTPESVRLRVDGEELELPSGLVVARRGVIHRSFQAQGRQLWLGARQVEFQGSCSIHPDPPPHGSCFDAQVTYRHAGRSVSIQGKLICGC